MFFKALKIVLGIILFIEFAIGIGLLFLVGMLWLNTQVLFLAIFYQMGRFLLFGTGAIITVIISLLLSYKLTQFLSNKIKSHSKIYSVVSIIPFLILIFLANYIIQDRAQSAFFANTNNYKNANPSNAALRDLQWKSAYTIFFVTDSRNLYAQKSNSLEHTLIYTSQPEEYIRDYFVIEPQNKLLVIASKKVLLMDIDGKNQKTLLEIVGDHSLMIPRLSQDRNILALAMAKGYYPNLREDSDEVYIINLLTNETQHLTGKDQLSNSVLINDVLWFINNTNVLFRTTAYPSDKPTVTKYIQYNIVTKKSEPIGEFNHPPVMGAETSKKISEFVDINGLFLPEPNNYEGSETYDKWEVKSPDKTKDVLIKNGIISVNNKDVFSWNYYNSLHNPGCRNPAWLPDTTHLIVLCSDEIRIIETDTKKAALFTKGVNPKWFDKYRNHFSRNDLK